MEEDERKDGEELAASLKEKAVEKIKEKVVNDLADAIYKAALTPEQCAESVDMLNDLKNPERLTETIEAMFKESDEDGNLLLDRDELSGFVRNFFYKFKITIEMNESQLSACF